MSEKDYQVAMIAGAIALLVFMVMFLAVLRIAISTWQTAKRLEELNDLLARLVTKRTK